MRAGVARLVLFSGDGVWRRFAATAAGVAVGVALLVTLLGAHAGLQARDARTWWMNLDVHAAGDASSPVKLTDDTALVSGHIEVFRGRPVWQLDVAVTPNSRVRLPDGLATPPAGSSLVSPALARLIDRVPGDQLGDRFGTVTDHLPVSMLKGPDVLVVIHMMDEQSLRSHAKLFLIDDFDGIQPSTNGVYSMMLIIGAVALMIPVILLVGIVTQLGAAQRRERLQTLRLIGATPGEVARLAAQEMALTTCVGGVGGVGLFFAIRPLAARVVVDGTSFYATDLAVSWWTALGVVALVVAASTVTAAWRVAAEGIGPLGVTKQTAEPVPGVVRLLPLLAGAALVATGAFGHLTAVSLRQYLAIGGFACTAVGIILAGPWLVHRLSGWLGRHAGSATIVVAAGWFRRHPAAAFRSVAGLVVALFLVSVFSGMASVATAGLQTTQMPGLMPPETATAKLAPDADVHTLQQQAARITGVTGTVIAYPSGQPGGLIVTSSEARLLGFAGVPDSGCAQFDASGFTNPTATEPAALTPTGCGVQDVPTVLFVRTDGTTAMERAQTWAAATPALATSLLTRDDRVNTATVGAVETLATMAYLGVLIAVIIAGISLAVASAAAVIDNKRTFGLMRLMGMPQGVLRQVIATQALIPLLATIAATIATGFLVAWMLITGWAPSLAMSWPDARYYLAIAAATGIAVIAVAATFPVAANNTRLHTTRFE